MRSTALVLWLMILLVFVPIGAMHGLARYLDEPAAAPQVTGTVAAPVRGG